MSKKLILGITIPLGTVIVGGGVGLGIFLSKIHDMAERIQTYEAHNAADVEKLYTQIFGVANVSSDTGVEHTIRDEKGGQVIRIDLKLDHITGRAGIGTEQFAASEVFEREAESIMNSFKNALPGCKLHITALWKEAAANSYTNHLELYTKGADLALGLHLQPNQREIVYKENTLTIPPLAA